MTDPSISTLAPLPRYAPRDPRAFALSCSRCSPWAQRTAFPWTRVRALLRFRQMWGACLGHFVGALSYIFILGDVKRMEVD